MFDDKRLYGVTDFYVAVVRDRDAALHTVGDLASVVFKAPQRTDFAFEHHHVVAQQTNLRVALDGSVRNAATGNHPDLRNAEGFEHLGASLIGFLNDGLQQPGPGTLNFLLELVDDPLQADIAFSLVRR